MRAVERTAISSAIQPPSEWPTIMHLAESQRVERIEIEERQIGDVVEPVGRVGFAEARMVGRHHIEALRERLERRLRAGEAPRPVQEQERRRPCRRAAD